LVINIKSIHDARSEKHQVMSHCRIWQDLCFPYSMQFTDYCNPAFSVRCVNVGLDAV